MQNIDDFRKIHPTWTPDNILLLSERKSEDAIRLEALLYEPCTKCHEEMGTHKWSMGKYHCPERELSLRDRKQLEDLKDMREASSIYRPQ